MDYSSTGDISHPTLFKESYVSKDNLIFARGTGRVWTKTWILCKWTDRHHCIRSYLPMLSPPIIFCDRNLRSEFVGTVKNVAWAKTWFKVSTDIAVSYLRKLHPEGRIQKKMMYIWAYSIRLKRLIGLYPAQWWHKKMSLECLHEKASVYLALLVGCVRCSAVDSSTRTELRHWSASLFGRNGVTKVIGRFEKGKEGDLQSVLWFKRML